MRDVRSGLSYLITGDLGCAEVHAARSAGIPHNSDYWRLAFVTDSDRDILLGELVGFDPARFAQPRIERFLFFKQDLIEAAERARLYADGHELPPRIDITDWLARNKQRLYFESSPAEALPDALTGLAWRALLPYKFADRFIALLAGKEAPETALQSLIRGIGRSDGIAGIVLDDGLCIKVVRAESQHMTVLKQFPLDEFTLAVDQPAGTEDIEAMPAAIVLYHTASQARLPITLDLFELLLRLDHGLAPASPELSALLEDLTPFKSRVQMSNTHDLVLVEGGRRMHRLTQNEGSVVCMPLDKRTSE